MKARPEARLLHWATSPAVLGLRRTAADARTGRITNFAAAMRKLLSYLPGARTADTFRAYALTLIRIMSWKAPLALVLMLCMTVAQSAQLLLLVPLMQVVGLDVEQSSIGWVAEFASSAFAAAGLQPSLGTVLVIFVLITSLLAALTRWQATFNFKLQQDFVLYMRRRLYRAIANMDWLTFSRIRSSDFTHVLTTVLDQVGGVTYYLLGFVTSIFLVTAYVILALHLSVTLTALVFATGILLLLLLQKKVQVARRAGEDVTFATRGLYSASIEHLSGMKTIKSYGAEERNSRLFSGVADRVAWMQLEGIQNSAETTFWFKVGSVVILSIMLYLSFRIMEMSVAGFLLLFFLFNRMIPLFGSVQMNYQKYINALPAFERVMEFLGKCEVAAEPKAEHDEDIQLQDSIRFEKVSFAYKEGERGAIRDLDMTIGAGKTTAIVGPSGAGKSTIADLVMGLILPSEGRVLVDGSPLGPEVMRSWREQIGYVAQETFLFNDTVRGNLLWARPDATDEEIWEALRLAAAEGFVSDLPDGLETTLGDRGVRLSGGERQRLALARALIRKPSLLILDEATSALDSENERRIQDAIEKLHGYMTILVITHRLSTIRRADIIYVLEGGRLEESGDWSTLLSKSDGRFGALCRAQDIGRGGETGSNGTPSPTDRGLGEKPEDTMTAASRRTVAAAGCSTSAESGSREHYGLPSVAEEA